MANQEERYGINRFLEFVVVPIFLFSLEMTIRKLIAEDIFYVENIFEGTHFKSVVGISLSSIGLTKLIPALRAKKPSTSGNTITLKRSDFRLILFTVVLLLVNTVLWIWTYALVVSGQNSLIEIGLFDKSIPLYTDALLGLLSYSIAFVVVSIKDNL
ncbi:MAG: hypothetical protein AAF960_07210 [Bacteroidota bacterium]